MKKNHNLIRTARIKEILIHTEQVATFYNYIPENTTKTWWGTSKTEHAYFVYGNKIRDLANLNSDVFYVKNNKIYFKLHVDVITKKREYTVMFETMEKAKEYQLKLSEATTEYVLVEDENYLVD